MFLISWLPYWVFHLLLVAGILALAASFVLKFVPFVTQYKLPIQAGAVLAIIVSVWFEGGISNEEKWQARVHELELKVAESEKQSAIANGQIDNKANKKIQVVKEVQYVVQERIRTEASKIDAQCKVDANVISILNAAANNNTGDKK
jgi:hypothetical protein